MKKLIWIMVVSSVSCTITTEYTSDKKQTLPEANYSLTSKQTHNKFSRTIEPVLTINSSEVVDISTEEATDGQLMLDSDTSDLMNLSFDRIHPLTDSPVCYSFYGLNPAGGLVSAGLQNNTQPTVTSPYQQN